MKVDDKFSVEGVLLLRWFVGGCAALSFAACTTASLGFVLARLLGWRDDDSSSSGSGGGGKESMVVNAGRRRQDSASTAQRLVQALILSDLLCAASALVAVFLPVDGVLPLSEAAAQLCSAQGFLVQYATLVTYCWTLTLAVHAYLAVVWRVKEKRLARLFWLYAALNTLLPLLPSLYGLLTGRYGPPDRGHYPIWCWVRPQYVDFRFGALYIPFAAVWLLTAVLFLAVLRTLHRLGGAFVMSALRRVAVYLLIFLLGYLPGLVNRSLEASDVPQIYWLTAVQCFCDNLVGLADCLVYAVRLSGCNKRALRLLCCCCPVGLQPSPAIGPASVHPSAPHSLSLSSSSSAASDADQRYLFESYAGQ